MAKPFKHHLYTSTEFQIHQLLTTNHAPPQYVTGNFYHIYNLGCSRLTIFHEPDDYLDVLKLAKHYSSKYNISVIAYCLLPNHYHFLLRQDDSARAGLLPQHVFNIYAKQYNGKYDHSGTIFEGHFKVKLVDSDAYLRQLCRYIHANPVLHGLRSDLEMWPYSNYLEWLERRGGSLVDRDFINTYFTTTAEYQSFVVDYVHTRQLANELDYLAHW